MCNIRRFIDAEKGQVLEHRQTDLRIIRSHNLLWEAMVALTVEKGFGRITVSDICTRAGVNRSTFYRHFEDKQDLLLRKTDEILYRMVEEARSPGEVVEDRDYSEYAAFLGFLSTHKDFFKIMLGAGGMQVFTDRIYSYLYDTTEKRLAELPLRLENPPVPLDLIVHYISGAHLSLLRWWIENDLPCTVDELVGYNLQLFSQDPLTLLGMSDEIMDIIRNS